MKNGMRVMGLLLAVSGFALSVGCGNNTAGTATTGSKEDVGEALAEVNGMVIGTKEFDEAFARTMPRGPEGENQDEATRKQEVLDRLVADKVLYQEALRQGLDKDPKIQRMMINTLLRKDVYGNIKNSDIGDEELQKYFDEHKDEFIVPEKVQVRRILIRVDGTTSDTDAKAKAETLLADVRKNPDSFKDIAIKESQDAYARRGGDIGFVSREGKPGLDPKVVEEAFKLEPNSISDAFKTDEGYNIVQVVNKRERVERSFEQMKGAVLRKLKTEKSKAIQDKYIEDLKKNAKVVKHEDKLKAHTPAKPSMPSMMPGMPGAGSPISVPVAAPGGAPEGAPAAPASGAPTAQ